MQKKRFLAALWALTKPYWVSEQRRNGLILLATVIGLALLGGVAGSAVQYLEPRVLQHL